MLSHKGTAVLETERLTLRPFRLEDAQAMYDNWAADPEVSRRLAWLPHKSVEETREILGKWIPLYKEPDYYHWVIVSKELGQPVGAINAHAVSDANESCEIGYNLARSCWNRGYTTEALGALLEFFFRQVGMERVCARHAADNPASGRVMEKAGMKREGVQRHAQKTKDGSFADLVEYSMLKAEWGM